jgi:hypothetical protein
MRIQSTRSTALSRNPRPACCSSWHRSPGACVALAHANTLKLRRQQFDSSSDG